MRHGLSLTAFGHATALFSPPHLHFVSASICCFRRTPCTRHGNTCFRDSSGSVGRASSWEPSKAMDMAGTWH